MQQNNILHLIMAFVGNMHFAEMSIKIDVTRPLILRSSIYSFINYYSAISLVLPFSPSKWGEIDKIGRDKRNGNKQNNISG